MGQSQGQPRPMPRPRPPASASASGSGSGSGWDYTGDNGSASSDSDRGVSSIDNATRWAQLEADGFALLPGVVDRKAIDRAMREINRSLGKHTPIRENMCPGVGGTKEITELLSKSPLKGILETLIGQYTGGGGGQIALRFPGDNTGPNFELHPGWENHWHIDGLSTPNSTQNSIPSGDIHNFTALVGVLLQDVLEENMGNLVLYPGSHFELQNHFRDNGFSEALTHGTSALPKLKFKRRPTQICGKAGDVVIANYMTAHLVAPNTSASVRYCIYFRLKGQSFQNQLHRTLRHRPESMLDVWTDWPRLTAMRGQRDREEAETEEDIKNAIAASATTTTTAAMAQPPPPAHTGGGAGDDDEELRQAIEASKLEY
jgi:hypothetical protein